MCSTVEPLINHPDFDRIIEPPAPKRRFARALANEGFSAKIWRAEWCSFVRGNKCANGHITLDSWNCDCRFCPSCSKMRIRSYSEDRKEVIRQLIADGIKTEPCKCGRYHSSKEFFHADVQVKVPHADLKRYCRDIRKYVNQSVFRKAGTSGHYSWAHIIKYDEESSTLTFRILFLSPRPNPFASRISTEWVKSLWSGAKVTVTVHPIQQLEQIFLFRLLDLTLLDHFTPEQRARQERLFDGIRLFRGNEKSNDRLGHLHDAGELFVLDPQPKTDNLPEDPYPQLPKNCKCRKCNAPIIARTGFMSEDALQKAVQSGALGIFREMPVPSPMIC